MIDNVIYEKRVSKCVTMGYLQQKNNNKNVDATPYSVRFRNPRYTTDFVKWF